MDHSSRLRVACALFRFLLTRITGFLSGGTVDFLPPNLHFEFALGLSKELGIEATRRVRCP